MRHDVHKPRLFPGNPSGERDVPRSPCHAGAIEHRAMQAFITAGGGNSLEASEEKERAHGTEAHSGGGERY